MKVKYTLTPKLRIFLKDPFGTLIEGLPQETMNKLSEIIDEKKPPRIISVGDIVSHNLHEYKINPQLTVIDHFSLRKKINLIEKPVEKTVYVKNPQGKITDEAIVAIKEALQTKIHTHIIVEGEEDLLTLIAVLYAPEKSIIVYGQPRCGIVLVEANLDKKEQVKKLLKEMKPSKS